MTNAALKTSALKAPAEWEVDDVKKIARHTSGLVVQFDRRKGQPAALDIIGLEKLSGTGWSDRVNILIEQGIALLDA
ncbi:MAG: hypothetical protein RBS08_01930 [Bdellovibrionales bacterium]|jgi:hypothetical protein|nr:hypothetical protein [Bdellovibrionales bacterium]